MKKRMEKFSDKRFVGRAIQCDVSSSDNARVVYILTNNKELLLLLANEG